MQLYCEQDVKVNYELLKILESHNYSQEAIKLEHDFAKIMLQQERTGVPFDSRKAELLFNELSERSKLLLSQIQAVIPPEVTKSIFIPKCNNKTLGYVQGVPIERRKENPFNPASRQQIYRYLNTTYQWEPDQWTEKNNPKMSAEVLENLEWPEVKLCYEYIQVKSLMGKIKTAKGAWLKNVKSDGRIHGYVNTNGAVTGRCTHSNPNLAQVPSPRKLLGKECRSLFHAPNGMVMVGCDASGLELRMLAHFLAPYDGGKYAEIVSTGDVHTANQNAAGLGSRDDAKRFIYAFLYGAGNAKLGEIVEPHSTKARRSIVGKKLKASFTANIEGLGELIRDVKNAARRGWLKGLDGRKLHVRSLHSALNTLLQSGGGLVMKKAQCIFIDEVKKAKLAYIQLLNIHDEYQGAAFPHEAEQVGEIAAEAITKAGEYFELRCPLAGEYNIGNNWSETH